MPGNKALVSCSDKNINTGAVDQVKTSWSRADYYWLLLISVLAGFVFFYHLADCPLFNPDEGLYAEPAREMLDTGQYVTTLLNYVVRFTKPPLIIWAMAFSYKIFGINEFAARFPCALSGFLLIIATYLFAKQYLGRRPAILSAAILLSSPLFIGVGRMAITDIPLSLFMAGSLFAFFHAWQQKLPIWLWVGYVLVGLAVMTKGPVGLILPGLILGIFFLLRGQALSAVRFFRLGWGGLIVGGIALPWFVTEIAITKGAYFREFILRENFARFTSVVDSHKGAWWYHLAAVFGGLFPWSIVLPQSTISVIKTVFGAKRSGQDVLVSSVKHHSSIDIGHWPTEVKRVIQSGLSSCRNLTLENEVLLFSLVSSVITIVFFSASVSKLLPYTLPAFPALAMIIAFQWHMFLQNKERKNLVIYCAIVLFIYGLAGLLSPVCFKYLRNAPPELTPLISHYGLIVSLAVLIALSLLLVHKLKAATWVLFGSIIGLTIIFMPKLSAKVAQFWEGDLPSYARFVSRTNQPLIVYQLRKPGIPFYFGRRVFQASKQGELNEIFRINEQCYVITKNSNLIDLQAKGCKMIAKDTNFVLLLSPSKH